jgi:hypothetical protein
LSSDGPQATGAARTVCDVQADSPPNSSRPKTAGQMDRNEDAQEHATNMKNPRPTGSTQTVRTYQADCPPGANRRGSSMPRAKTRSPYHISFHGSPKQLKLLRKDLGKMCSVSRGCYDPRLGSSNELNCRELNRHRTQPKT